MQEQHSSATWRWVWLALLWLSTGLSAAPLQQDPGADGLVVMEAENLDANTPQGSNTWGAVTSPAGFSGTSAYRALPDGTTGIFNNYAANSPRLDYQVNFAYAGTHTVWILGRGDTRASNSVHVGLDGIELPDPDQALYFNVGTGWEWSTVHQTSAQVTVEVPSAGVHTVNVWMRESGTYVDKLLLTVNPDYVPDGTEPESPRGTGGGGTLFEDNFDDGDALGWNVVNNCVKGAPDWQWYVDTFMQIGDCRGFSFPQGVSIGTYALSGTALPANVDIQLRLRAQDPATDGPTGNDASIWKYGGIGLLFGYQDADNYYRVELDGIEGHRKLRRKQGGTFTELNTSPQSLVPGQWHDLRVVHQNGVILVFVDGQQVMASADSAFSTGQLGLFCARNASCSFDDILVTAAADTPMVGLNLPDGGVSTHASGEYYVTTSTGLDVAALTSVSTGVGGVEFLLDEGPGETSLVDDTPPYSAQFAAPGAGEHSVTAWLLDSGQARMAAPEARVVFPQVGVGGIHLYAMGDSITAGIFDSISADDDSADGRNTGGGYEPVLNDYLTAANGVPVTVLNDGNSGETSTEGAARVAATLAGSPQAQAYLVFYGANDSGGGTPTDSGLGLSCTDLINFTGCDTGYLGSFKHNLQQIINAVTGAGKQIFLARAPPNLNSSQRNMRLIEYNMVVDELVAEGGGGYVPPDLHAWFTANQVEFDSDGVHPNGTGYISIARLWCEALNTQMGLWCLDADRDGLVDSVETGQGTNPSLVDSDGDGLADGNDGLVPLAALPGGVDSDGDGFVDGEAPLGTDPLLPDSDGDRLDDGVEVANGADPLDPGDWPALADGDMAPLDAPDGDVNAADLLLGVRMTLGLLTPTALELAHGDLYPPGSPDGVFNLQDLILLQGMMQ